MEEDLTREKQIQEAAQEYSFDNPNGDWDSDCRNYKFDYDTPCIDFKAGAIWADEHPKEGFWDKERVIKWLKENIWIFTYLDEDNNAMIDEDTLINELRKVMEE